MKLLQDIAKRTGLTQALPEGAAMEQLPQGLRPERGQLSLQQFASQISRCMWCLVKANVNDYSRDGSRLLLHWDDRGLYEECVCSLTVMGDCVMTFQMGGKSNLSKSSSESGGVSGAGLWQSLCILNPF